MGGSFIFQPVWPILSLLRLNFPLHKIQNENGDVILKPWSNSTVLLINAVVFLALFVAFGIDLSALKEVDSFDDVVKMAAVSMFVIQICFIALTNLSLKEGLARIQNHCNQNIRRTRSDSGLKWIYFLLFAMYSIGSITYSVPVAVRFQLPGMTETKMLIKILAASYLGLFFVLFDTILVTFLIYFGESCQTIIACLDSLILGLCDPDLCFNALEMTEMVGEAFKKQILVVVSCTALNVLGLIYVCISFFITFDLDLYPCLAFTAMVLFSLANAILTFVLTSQSQQIIDKYQLLHKQLISSEKFQEKDWKIKNTILFMLEKFDGFSACGYFKLSKSLIPSIIGNLLTYIVILVQFKVSYPDNSASDINLDI